MTNIKSFKNKYLCIFAAVLAAALAGAPATAAQFSFVAMGDAPYHLPGDFVVVDKPLYQGRQLIYNVTRLMVFGDSEVQGVTVHVDTDGPDVFSIRPLTTPENPAPPTKPKP